jgi:ribosomal protein L37AE/L43A
MARTRRKRLPTEILKAHDWVFCRETTIAELLIREWICTKCGVTYGNHRKPSRYVKYVATTRWINDIQQEILRPAFGPGMLCDEIVTWKIMET